MTKRRMRLGIGLDQQKLADTIRQVFDTSENLPSLTLDVHAMDDGWLHLTPQTSREASDNPAEVIGWLMTFGFPHSAQPLSKLAELDIKLDEGGKLASWESGLYVSLWLPPGMSFADIAQLAIELITKLLAVPSDAHIEVALEFGR